MSRPSIRLLSALCLLTCRSSPSTLEVSDATTTDLATPELAEIPRFTEDMFADAQRAIWSTRNAELPQVTSWRRSNLDPRVHFAILRKTYGNNEVSCLFEGFDANRVDRVELELEVYGQQVDEHARRIFEGTARSLCDEPEILAALAAGHDGTAGAWTLETVTHSAGFDIRLAYRR